MWDNENEPCLNSIETNCTFLKKWLKTQPKVSKTPESFVWFLQLFNPDLHSLVFKQIKTKTLKKIYTFFL